MKKISIFSAIMAVLLFGTVALTSTSCQKNKTRKEIAGSWTLTEVTIDGNPYPGTVSGTIEFGSCSASENRKGECTAVQNITLTYNGSTQTQNATLLYRILKKGKEMQYDESVVEIELDDSSLTMTFNEDGEIIKYFLTK